MYNSPLSDVDPTGSCDVVVGGITQSPNTPSTAAQTDFANLINADLIYPYNGGSGLGGVLNVVSQGLGINTDAVNTTVAGITQAAADPGPINVFTFSGGAQAFNSALPQLPADLRGRIGNVTYIEPGSVSDLSSGNGNTTVISNNFGLDALIEGGSVGSASLLSTDCSHSADCAFRQQLRFLAQQSGTPCSNRKTISNTPF